MKPITDVAEVAGKVTKMKARIGKHSDEMGFDECMAHVRRVLFWDPVDGQWTDIDFLNSAKWDRLAGCIADAHERELESLRAENDGLRRQNLDLRHDLVSERCRANQTEADERRAVADNEKLRRLVTIMRHCIAGGCDLCEYRKNSGSEDVECELDELKRELGI